MFRYIPCTPEISSDTWRVNVMFCVFVRVSMEVGVNENDSNTGGVTSEICAKAEEQSNVTANEACSLIKITSVMIGQHEGL